MVHDLPLARPASARPAMTVWLRGVVLGLLTLPFVVSEASAQSSITKYLFVAPGVLCCDGTTKAVQFGGGVELPVTEQVKIGLEIGYLTEPDTSDGFGTWSANGSYHFRSVQSKLRPFVGGGYTMAFVTNATANLFNVGGGVDYWIGSRVGLRLEARDQILSDGSGHFVGGRFAIVFR